MKFKYIFYYRDNGYGLTHDFYLFESDKELTNEIAQNIQKRIPGAGRTGINFNSFCEKAEKDGYNFTLLMVLNDIPIIENITGNY
jgi:hypothetical protein